MKQNKIKKKSQTTNSKLNKENKPISPFSILRRKIKQIKNGDFFILKREFGEGFIEMTLE